jgi:hypothetical protein
VNNSHAKPLSVDGMNKLIHNPSIKSLILPAKIYFAGFAKTSPLFANIGKNQHRWLERN